MNFYDVYCTRATFLQNPTHPLNIYRSPDWVTNAVITGWDPDEASIDGINPNVLISLIAPKRCALNFSGTHLLAGRLLPYDIQRKYELNLPKFPSTACITELH